MYSRRATDARTFSLIVCLVEIGMNGVVKISDEAVIRADFHVYFSYCFAW